MLLCDALEHPPRICFMTLHGSLQLGPGLFSLLGHDVETAE